MLLLLQCKFYGLQLRCKSKAFYKSIQNEKVKFIFE